MLVLTMKILYANPTVYPSFMASSIQILNACVGFHNAGHDITLYCGREGEVKSLKSDIKSFYGVDAPFPIISFKKAGGRVPNVATYCFYFLKALFKVECDVVYTRSLLLSILSLVKKKKVFFEVHDLPSKKQAFLIRLLSGRLKKGSIVLSSPSKSLLRYYSRFIVDHCETVWTPHGSSHISLEKRSVSEEGAAVHGSNFSTGTKNAKDFLCVYVGSIGVGKGLDFVHDLAKKMPEIKFKAAVLCKSPTQMERIEKSAPKNLEIVYNLDSGSIRGLYKKADVLLLPIEKYTGKGGSKEAASRQLSPLRAYEYLSAEKPIVASDIWPNLEIFKILKHAACFQLDTNLWAGAILALRDDSDNLMKRCESARVANELYSWERRAERVNEACRRSC